MKLRPKSRKKKVVKSTSLRALAVAAHLERRTAETAAPAGTTRAA